MEDVIIMSSIKKIYISVLSAVLALSVIGGAALVFAVHGGYDAKLQHFEAGNAPLVISAICFVLAVLGAVVSAFASRGLELELKAPSYLTRFTSAFAAVLLVFSFVMTLAFGGFSELDILGRLASLLGLLSAVYFLVVAFDTKLGGALPLLSIVCLLRSVAVLMQVYFSSLYAINAPIKSYLLVLYSAEVLFFCAETRISLDRKKAPRLVMFTLAEVACGAVAPALLVCDLMGEEILLFDLLTSITMTVIWLFSVSRAVSFIGALQKSTADVAAASEEADAPDGE